MYIPKRYGQSKIDKCPFCGKSALVKNKQGVAVCATHKVKNLPEMKCACGKYLEMRDGKFGPFFTCISCGAVSMAKALAVNDVNSEPFSVAQPAKRDEPGNDSNRPREIQITSDDPSCW